ncbi:MAG: hypothetical protein UT13_C0002G0001, partial [Candidatus Pacebacteria bacterium GW2011_GWF2_38_9]
SKVPEVLAAGITDEIFGFVCYNIKGNEFAAGDAVEIAGAGCVQVMEAAAAFAPGTDLMFQVSGTKVLTQTAGNTCIGKAIDKSAADTNLVRVFIDPIRVTAAKLEANIALPAPNLTFGVASHDYAGAHADWTLSAVEAKANVLVVTNADAAGNIVATPTAGKVYILVNTSGQIITMKAAGQTGVAVASTKTALLRGTGTDFARVTADA